MNRIQDFSINEANKYKSLVLKFTLGEEPSEKDYMAYLTKRFWKILRKNRGFKKGGNPPRAAISSATCHKYGKAAHFLRDCPMLKAEKKVYQSPRCEKGKRRDLVPNKLQEKLQLTK